jgi:hypothetical protein
VGGERERPDSVQAEGWVTWGWAGSLGWDSGVKRARARARESESESVSVRGSESQRERGIGRGFTGMIWHGLADWHGGTLISDRSDGSSLVLLPLGFACGVPMSLARC